MRLLPTPVLSFTDIHIGDAEQPDVEMERFRAEVELAPLLKGEVRIIQMAVERPRVHVEISGLAEDLATLIKGGVELDRALLILSEAGVRPAVAGLLHDLHREISAGHSLAEAISNHPKLFPKTFVKMVEVAEIAGCGDQPLGGKFAHSSENKAWPVITCTPPSSGRMAPVT